MIFQGVRGVKFHIKNIVPVNNNDIFSSIEIDNQYYQLPVHAAGMSADTVVYYFHANPTLHYLSYTGTFIKNGMEQVIPRDTIFINPLDTAAVDVFY